MNDPISALTGRKILITGGAGNLAFNLVRQLQDVDCSIIRLDRPGAIFPPLNSKAQVRDVEGDIRDYATWESALTDVDIVFHFAAQTSSYVAEQDPRADLQINVMPMLSLLEVCRKSGSKPIVLFSGTATEVGLLEQLPVDETQADHPITIYDLHKLMAENYLKYYTEQGIVRGAILRLANVYGPGPKSSSADRGVLNLMIRNALARKPLTVYGDGNYVRDYVYVEDVARAFVYAAANADRVMGGHFPIGSGEPYTIAQAFQLVAERVALKTGFHAPVVNVDPPPSLLKIETRNFVADTRHFTDCTGWQVHYSFTDGIDRTIDSYLAAQEKG